MASTSARPQLRSVSNGSARQTTSRSRRSLTPWGGLKHGSKAMQEANTYLRELLPSGWDSYFSVRRAGSYYGLFIQCPVCSLIPPPEVQGSRRWRWLAVHITRHEKDA
jgi:hypothetical protein